MLELFVHILTNYNIYSPLIVLKVPFVSLVLQDSFARLQCETVTNTHQRGNKMESAIGISLKRLAQLEIKMQKCKDKEKLEELKRSHQLERMWNEYLYSKIK